MRLISTLAFAAAIAAPVALGACSTMGGSPGSTADRMESRADAQHGTDSDSGSTNGTSTTPAAAQPR
jgi:hypothetical protein